MDSDISWHLREIMKTLEDELQKEVLDLGDNEITVQEDGTVSM